ncbi:pseudouridine synthase [Streptococcus equinus]|uniref:pseudouridine synthase n=1 Tax=Streptococcus equinus TaxID=1335 RepID=UPI00088E48DB|nr:pseudouridine synthase [Streptococcus equinus]SDI56567.1 16S rRNA pseudouridine516 synthase [Streptococcus equinus]SEP68820.1 16S rRNA pseudouridine516 synthase [Streptococcus equinus]
MRLDKLLGQAGFGSRNQVKKLIRSRQVYVDGRLAEADNLNVEPSLQEITVSGKQVTLSTEKYFILNKPVGVVSAVSDKEHQTVIDLIAESDRVPKLYPVGRLDRDTEGFLLITNNGPLGYRMLHPKYHVTKTYYVEVNGCLADDAPTFFENGVTFNDGTICKPAKLEITESSSEKSSAYITIAEGKFHQVKKMFLAYGVKVTYLKRMTFGEFELGDLPTGNYRELTINEKEILKNYLD